MNTFNKFRQFRKESQVLRFFEFADNNRKLSNQRGYVWKGQTFSTSYANRIWAQVGKEFSHWKLKEFKLHIHFDKNWNQVEGLKACFESWIYIHTSLNYCFEPSIDFTVYFSGKEQRISFWPNSNQEITRETIIQAVRNYVEKFLLFPKGRFRDFQVARNLNKEQTIKELNYLKKHQENQVLDLSEWFERKFNIVYCESIFCNSEWKEAIEFAIRYTARNGRPKKTLYLYNEYRFTPDCYDQDEPEKLISDLLNDIPEDTIFINYR